MPIRATPSRRRTTRSRFPTALAALALAGCGPAAPSGDEAQADGGGAGNCLSEVWRQQAKPDKPFDKTHDAADGGTFSCATGTSASQFATALAAIRRAAADGDRASLTAAAGLPLLYIDKEGKRRELDRQALLANANDVFSPPVLALLAKLQLSNLSVVPREGAFAELGAVWLMAGRTGGAPRIVTIDLQALDEARAASRRHAQAPE